MSQTCFASAHAGLVLILSFVVVMALYWRALPVLTLAYSKAKPRTNSCTRSVFVASEFLVTLSWVTAGIMCLVDTSEFEQCGASNTFFAACLVFATGAILWPLCIDELHYTNLADAPFPHFEEVATTTTAVGSTLAASAAVYDPGARQNAVRLACLFFMAYHYIFVDLIGWTYIRFRLRRHAKSTSVAAAALSAEWTRFPESVLRAESQA